MVSHTFKLQHALCGSYIIMCYKLRILRWSGGVAWGGVAGKQWDRYKGGLRKAQEVSPADGLLLCSSVNVYVSERQNT